MNKIQFFFQRRSDLSPIQKASYDRYRRIAWSGLTSTIAKIASAVVGLITVPLVFHHIGKELYGLWMVVTSLVLWMQISDLGIANGLANAIAEANGRDDHEASSGYLSAALIFSTALVLFLAPMFYLLVQFFPWAIVLKINEPGMQALARQSFLIIGLSFLINVPISLASRVYMAYQKSYYVSLVQIVSSINVLLILVFSVQMDLSFLWIIGLYAFTPIFHNLILWLGFGPAELPVRLTWHCRSHHLSRVMVSSFPLLFFMFGGLCVNQLINVILTNIGGLSLVAEYNVIQKVYLFIFVMASSLSTPFYAAFREAYERDEINWLRRAIKNSLITRFLLLIPVSITLIAIGDYLIAWWMSNSIRDLGHTGWSAVVLSLVLSSLSSLLSETLISLEDIWSQAMLVYISAFVVILLLLNIVPFLGVPGIYISLAMSTLFPTLYSRNRLIVKLNGK